MWCCQGKRWLFGLIGLFGGIGVPGFATLVLLICFFGGMTLFSVGLIGEYLIRIIDEVTGAPRYVVRQVVEGRSDRRGGEIDP